MNDYKMVLNAEQLEAVTTTEGPVLIIAGAGTGKTRTLVYRTSYLIEHGAAPSSILLLTFTNKAADEMKERVASLLGDEVAKDITACTFHSFCARFLRRYFYKAGLDANFTIISGSDDTDIIDLQKAAASRGEYDKRGFPPSKKIADIISKSINMNMSVENTVTEFYSEYISYIDEIVQLKESVDAYKKENSMLNYDDLLVAMNQTFIQHPEVADELSDMFSYIMVDEYQDTNAIQDKLLLAMRRHNRNLAVVGDDLQSLYGFRGAEVQYIIDFPKRIPGTKIIKLVKNYRSSQEILDLSNEVSSHATEGYYKELVGTHHSQFKPCVHYVSDADQEAYCIMEKIFYLYHTKNISLKEICVLSRTSYAMAKVEMLLQKEGYDYVKYGGIKLFDREDVKTILSYLRVLSRPSDEIAWFKILQVHSGIGKAYAKDISAECKKEGIIHLTDKRYARRKYRKELISLYDKLVSLNGLSLQKAVDEILSFYDETKTKNIASMRVRHESNRTEIMEAHQESMMMLKSVFPDLVAPYNTITKFLDELVLDNTKATQNHSKDGAVTLSTIHSVKGLEFDAVIIMDCVNQMFPSVNEKDVGSKEDNEELRCFYVAVTRAREELHLMCPEYLKKFNQPFHGTISHYISENSDNIEKIKHPYRRIYG